MTRHIPTGLRPSRRIPTGLRPSRRTRGRIGLAAVALVSSLTLSGCTWTGLNSLPLPGTTGRGDGSFKVDIIMPDVSTVTQNSPVLVDDVTVGTISNIVTDGWNARVTVSLQAGLELPENSTAKVGQTSLLGSQHISIDPPTDEPPTGQLKGGDTIPLERAGVYPSTEQTLSSLSVVLNGGGIDQLHTVTSELNNALDGNGATTTDLFGQIDKLVGTLDTQRGDIVAALDGLNRLAASVGAQKQVLADAVEQIGPALKVLAEDRENITAALASTSRLGEAAEQLISTSKQDLVTDLGSLSTVLKNVAASGQDTVKALDSLPTFPFPQALIDNGMKGDYTNLFLSIDLTVDRIRSGLLAGTALGPSAVGPEAIVGVPAATTATEPTNPFTDPLGAVNQALSGLAAPLQQLLPGPTQPASGLPGPTQPASGLPGPTQPASGLPGPTQPASGLPGPTLPATGGTP